MIFSNDFHNIVNDSDENQSQRIVPEAFSVSFVGDKISERNIKVGKVKQNQDSQNFLTIGSILKRKTIIKSWEKFKITFCFDEKNLVLWDISPKTCLIYAQEFN